MVVGMGTPGTAEIMAHLGHSHGAAHGPEMGICKDDIHCLGFQGICDGDGYLVLRERARSVEDDTNSLLFVTQEDYNRIMGTEKTLQEGEIFVYSNRQDYPYETMRLFDRQYRVAEKLEDFIGNGEYELIEI